MAHLALDLLNIYLHCCRKQHIQVFQNTAWNSAKENLLLEDIASNFPFFIHYCSHSYVLYKFEMVLHLETLSQARNKLTCEREQDLVSTWTIASFLIC